MATSSKLTHKPHTVQMHALKWCNKTETNPAAKAGMNKQSAFSSFPHKPHKWCHGESEGLLFLSITLEISDKEAVLQSLSWDCVCLGTSGGAVCTFQECQDWRCDNKGHWDMNVASQKRACWEMCRADRTHWVTL